MALNQEVKAGSLRWKKNQHKMTQEDLAFALVCLSRGLKRGRAGVVLSRQR